MHYIFLCVRNYIMIGKVIAQLLTRDKWSSHEIGNKLILKSIFAHIQLKYYMGKLMFYCLCCCISVSPFVLFPFSVLRLIPALYANFPAFYAKLSCYYLPCVVTYAQCANGGRGGRMGGVESFLDLGSKLSSIAI